MEHYDDNNDFDSIMEEIVSGLTRDPETDIAYLKDKMEEYKDHEMSEEISVACGRLIYMLLPDDQKENFEEAMDDDLLRIDDTLDEVRRYVYQQDYEKALDIISNLVDELEELDMFQDDAVSEYHTFNEMFEDFLYYHLYHPTKEPLRAPIPYSEIYGLYGSILVDLGRTEEARAALRKGLRWNPIDFDLTTEYIETFKMDDDLDTFFEETVKAFQIAFRPESLARCYRNLGYYFVEKSLFPPAIACYALSSDFEENEMVQSELYYIEQVSGEPITLPPVEDLERFADQYGFPLGAADLVLGLAYSLGQDFLDDKEYVGARYCFNILYDLTEDEEIKDILDQIPE